MKLVLLVDMNLIIKILLKLISGKNKYKFDIVQESFAWITDNKLKKND